MYSFTGTLKIHFLLFQTLLGQTKVTNENTESIISRALYKLLLQHANAKFTVNFFYENTLKKHYFEIHT